MAACNTCTPLKDEFRPSTSWTAVELQAIWHHKGKSSCCTILLIIDTIPRFALDKLSMMLV